MDLIVATVTWLTNPAHWSGASGIPNRVFEHLALSLGSLAIATLIALQLGFKVLPTAIAMVALAMPPILVNTVAGVTEVDADLVESARGMGLTELQVLRDTELPLALPAIATGLGSAAVQVIATATLGALFGFGGLGAYLAEGIAQNDDGMIFGGVVLVAVLALAAERAFTLAARALGSPGLAAVTPEQRTERSAISL